MTAASAPHYPTDPVSSTDQPPENPAVSAADFPQEDDALASYLYYNQQYYPAPVIYRGETPAPSAWPAEV